jgi:uncharacterized protein (UPF0332 family)
LESGELNQLIKYRLDQARDALADARYLLGGGRSPQGIINRSYYAMFYAAMALMQAQARIPNKHTGVLGLFDTEFVMRGLFPKELSRDFHRAFELRQSSDYRFLEPFEIDDAVQLLEKAERFVEAVATYLAGKTQGS